MNPIRTLLGTLGPTLVLLLAFVVGWELVVRAESVPAYLVPAPSAIAERWLRDPLFFVTEGGVSLAEALGGLVVGGGAALSAAVLRARPRWVERGLLAPGVGVNKKPGGGP